MLREYAKTEKLTVVREFTDVETAKATGRTGFGEMLAFLKVNPTCRTILVEKTRNQPRPRGQAHPERSAPFVLAAVALFLAAVGTTVQRARESRERL